MQSRRQLLQQAVMLPVAWPRRGPTCGVLGGADCLSQESAEGYRRAAGRNGLSDVGPSGADLVFVAGGSGLSPEDWRRLRARAIGGAWIVWELAGYASTDESRAAQEIFDVRLSGQPLDAGLYLSYLWPTRTLIRRFGSVQPVVCRRNEAIARVEESTVAMRRRMGRGGLVFLGSMLGPHLRAEDREAEDLFRSLLRPISVNL